MNAMEVSDVGVDFKCAAKIVSLKWHFVRVSPSGDIKSKIAKQLNENFTLVQIGRALEYLEAHGLV